MAFVKKRLQEALDLFSGLTDENFLTKVHGIQKVFEELNQKNDLLKKRYPEAELRKYHPELRKITKEIERKFDNVIREKKDALGIVSEKLKTLSNRKKLVNYIG